MISKLNGWIKYHEDKPVRYESSIFDLSLSLAGGSLSMWRVVI